MLTITNATPVKSQISAKTLLSAPAMAPALRDTFTSSAPAQGRAADAGTKLEKILIFARTTAGCAAIAGIAVGFANVAIVGAIRIAGGLSPEFGGMLLIAPPVIGAIIGALRGVSIALKQWDAH